MLRTAWSMKKNRENGTVPAEEPVEAEEKQSSAEDAVNPVSGRRRGLSGLTQEECMSALIEFDEVCKYYQMGDTTVKAADHITMKIEKASSWPSWASPAPANPPA